MQSPSFGTVTDKEMIDIISKFMSNKESRSGQYKFIIGTDSQMFKKKTLFVTALIIHRVGNCGIYFYRKVVSKRSYCLAERMFEEATLSLQLASELMNLIKNYKCSFCDYMDDLEIHVDVGSKGKTKELINNVVGMITGCGYKVKYKPEAYAASTVADKYTKS